MNSSSSSLDSVEETLTEAVLRVRGNVEVFAKAVRELVLLVMGELIVGVASLLEDLPAAGAEGMSKHEACLCLLH